MSSSNWLEATASRLDAAEQKLDKAYGFEERWDFSALPPPQGPAGPRAGASSSSSGYKDFPSGIATTDAEELQAMRMGHTAPQNFDPGRHIFFVHGRPVMATALLTGGSELCPRSNRSSYGNRRRYGCEPSARPVSALKGCEPSARPVS